MKPYLAFVALSGSIYFLVNQLTHSYRWSTLFTQTFIQLLSDPAHYHAHVSVPRYLATLVFGFQDLTWTTIILAVSTLFALKELNLYFQIFQINVPNRHISDKTEAGNPPVPPLPGPV